MQSILNLCFPQKEKKKKKKAAGRQMCAQPLAQPAAKGRPMLFMQNTINPKIEDH